MPWFSQSEPEPESSPDPSLDDFKNILAAARAGLESVKAGDAVELAAGRAVFVPLVRKGDEPHRDHLTLEEALRQGLEIKELEDQVSRLHIHNPLKEKVLGVEGEILKGCKQNRTLNTTLMVDAETRLGVPVSCVQAGRWSAPMGPMSKGSIHASRDVRRSVRESVSDNLKAGGPYMSNQGKVWDEISTYSGKAGEGSSTGDFDEVAKKEARRPSVAGVGKTLRDSSKGATGCALAVDGHWVSAEMVGHSEDWKVLGPSILRGMAGEISRLGPTKGQAPSFNPDEDPRDLLFALLDDRATPTRSPGLGWDLRAVSPDGAVHLCALVEANQLRWLSALGR